MAGILDMLFGPDGVGGQPGLAGKAGNAVWQGTGDLSEGAGVGETLAKGLGNIPHFLTDIAIKNPLEILKNPSSALNDRGEVSITRLLFPDFRRAAVKEEKEQQKLRDAAISAHVFNTYQKGAGILSGAATDRAQGEMRKALVAQGLDPAVLQPYANAAKAERHAARKAGAAAGLLPEVANIADINAGQQAGQSQFADRLAREQNVQQGEIIRQNQGNQFTLSSRLQGQRHNNRMGEIGYSGRVQGALATHDATLKDWNAGRDFGRMTEEERYKADIDNWKGQQDFNRKTEEMRYGSDLNRGENLQDADLQDRNSGRDFKRGLKEERYKSDLAMDEDLYGANLDDRNDQRAERRDLRRERLNDVRELDGRLKQIRLRGRQGRQEQTVGGANAVAYLTDFAANNGLKGLPLGARKQINSAIKTGGAMAEEVAKEVAGTIGGGRGTNVTVVNPGTVVNDIRREQVATEAATATLDDIRALAENDPGAFTTGVALKAFGDRMLEKVGLNVSNDAERRQAVVTLAESSFNDYMLVVGGTTVAEPLRKALRDTWINSDDSDQQAITKVIVLKQRMADANRLRQQQIDGLLNPKTYKERIRENANKLHHDLATIDDEKDRDVGPRYQADLTPAERAAAIAAGIPPDQLPPE